MASAGSIQADKALGATDVFYIAGSFIVLVSVVEAFGLKDIYQNRDKDKVGDEKTAQEKKKEPTTKELLFTFLSYIWKEKSCLVVYFTGFATSMGIVCTAQYGILCFK